MTKLPWKKILVFTLFVLFFSLSACFSSSHLDTPYGLQPNHSSFIPARIAIFNCQPWPNGSRYNNLPLSNASVTEITDICKKFDEFTMEGFKGQPYMKGFSPSAVSKFLAQSDKRIEPSQLMALWQHLTEDCFQCTTAPSFYSVSIANRTNWKIWLNHLSKTVRNADAILLPFVVFAYHSEFNDRGVVIKTRAAGLALFLIDTDNGNLIWAGGREANSNNQKFESTDNRENFAFPEWEAVYSRLFTEDIWKEFPGRQVF